MYLELNIPQLHTATYHIFSINTRSFTSYLQDEEWSGQFQDSRVSRISPHVLNQIIFANDLCFQEPRRSKKNQRHR